MTDVKSECNSTNEPVNQTTKSPDHNDSIHNFDDSEEILPSSVKNSPLIGCKNNTKTSEKMVGLLTASERKLKVQRYLDKKKRRRGEKSVRYECRQDLASKRFRYQGRFIRFEDLHKFKGKLIIDYTERKLIKPIFQITKVSR
uniref:CCT domain-containing protein n=1 Tax=Euplotes crassus TaxID=5936 RepID=A0A7S3NVU2_EUPCR|mmetsp:Transcript_22537/g.22360  ORF Transcript_22537/g.22360 Transcript_22537/m.22360 type:complete len:143 (+) Transcript_22537:503-931(+)